MTTLPLPRESDDEAPAPRRAPIKAAPLRQLLGHSGATLLLFDRGRNGVVRKIAADLAGGARLHRQAALQRSLASYSVPFPHVLEEGFDETGRAYFEMDYVPADNLAAILAAGGRVKLDAIMPALDWVMRFFRLSASEMLPPQKFHAKIDQIVRTCSTRPACSSHESAIANTAARLHALPWERVPSSLSHGDMTLENMLVCPARGLVFIDCDDGFASSYWLDAGKIFQDTIGHWCLRDAYLSGGPGAIQAVQRLDRMAAALRGLVASVDPMLALRLPQFAALNLFRTLPYAHDANLAGWVLQRIAYVLNRTRL
jgi:aminoglycoside phosphotransferase